LKGTISNTCSKGSCSFLSTCIRKNGSGRTNPDFSPILFLESEAKRMFHYSEVYFERGYKQGLKIEKPSNGKKAQNTAGHNGSGESNTA
jgi:hypothetical protein